MSLRSTRFNYFSFLSLATLAVTLLITGTSTAVASTHRQKTHKLSVPTHPERNKVTTPGTPFDRVIRPGLTRALAKNRGQFRTKSLTRAAKVSAPGNFGGFLAAPEYLAYDAPDQDTSPLSVFASGDFNKDGKQDLATIQASGTVTVILNQGGGFSAPITTPTPTNNVGGALQAIATDLNKDGYDDLLLLDQNNNTFDVMLNKGDGTFGTPQFVSIGSNYAGSMASADLNGDGYPDVVVLSSTTNYDSNGIPSTVVEMDTYLNDGSGGFKTPTGGLQQIFTLPDAYDTLHGRSIALTDVTGDGIIDATVQLRHWLDNPTSTSDSEHIIMTFPGAGQGVFNPRNDANNVVIPSESTFNIGYPLVANLNVVDINQDGHKDVVFSYQDYNIWAALGNGDGTYQYQYNVGAPQAYPTDMIVADVNGDGIPDLVDAEPNYLGIYPNRGDGTFDTSIIPYYGSGMGQFSVLATADFNGDGLPDTALMNSIEGSVTIFAGVATSPASVHAAQLINPAMGYVGKVVGQAVLDTNGDGLDDVLLYNQGGATNNPALLTALGDGKGNFVYKNALPGYNPTSLDFIDSIKGDFNGDGHDDLVLHTFQGVYLLLSNGDGTFQSKAVQLSDGFNCSTHYAAIGDVNGDGKLDLVIAYEGDQVYMCNSGTLVSGFFVLLGNGDGTFQPAKFTAVGDEVYEPTLIDTNNDGKLDVIVSDVPFDLLDEGISPANFNTFQMLGNGDGTFQAPVTLAPNYINAHTLVADINGDGKADLVFLSEGLIDPSDESIDTSKAGALPQLANGNGTYVAGTLFGPGFFSSGGLLTDLNGDGKPDLLLSEYISYDFTQPLAGGVAALGNGDGTFTATGNFEVGDESSIVLGGDFLKDGSPDAVFVSGGSGSTLVLSQGGSTVVIKASPSSITAGQTVDFAVSVTASMAGRPQPTGTVTLTENGSSLGSGELSSGTANISVSGLSAGSHTVTAVYSGDSNFNVNSLSSASVQVLPTPAVTVTASTQSLTLKEGQSGTISLTAAANSSYSGDVSFSVAGAPAGMSVSITPPQVALIPGQTATAVLAVSTTAPKSSGLQWPMSAGGGLSVAGIFLLFIPRKRRILSSLAVMCLFFGTFTGLLGLTGCGGGSSIAQAPKGTTKLTITATPAGSSAPAQTITVTVTVQ